MQDISMEPERALPVGQEKERDFSGGPASPAQDIEILARSCGLDFYPVVFEEVSSKELNMIAAREGFPVRYPHWRWAVEYNRLSKGYEYGTSKIYELVINTDPVYAYLMNTNSDMERKLVMAHVFAHADFFKNNMFFDHTDRNMLNEMGAHAARIRQYMDLYGRNAVEEWIDVCRSIDSLIDPVPRDIEVQQERRVKGIPEQPERDLMRFLIEYGEMEDWRRDVLSIVRKEALYFLPQAQTKIMNEGWAAYWHSKMMAEEMLLAPEVVDYCDSNAGVLAQTPGSLNPYKLGVELFKDIERRWDEAGGNGREKIFEVRRTHNDLTFLDDFMTLEFCERQGLVDFGSLELSQEEKEEYFAEQKAALLVQFTNHGQPTILLTDANFRNTGGLLLEHQHEGLDLDLNKARAVMENLYAIWKKPVYLRTVLYSEEVLLKFNGAGWDISYIAPVMM